MPRSQVVRRQGLEPRTRGLRIASSAVSSWCQRSTLIILTGQTVAGDTVMEPAEVWSVHGELTLTS
jgi:hypothetical protein